MERRSPPPLWLVIRRKGDVQIAIDQQVHSNLEFKVSQLSLRVIGLALSPLDRVIWKCDPVEQPALGHLVLAGLLLTLFVF